MVAYIGNGEPCCQGVRGNVNNDGSDANILDLTFLVDYIFRGDVFPSCFEEADLNVDCAVNLLDLVFQVDYGFRGGAPPGPCP